MDKKPVTTRLDISEHLDYHTTELSRAIWLDESQEIRRILSDGFNIKESESDYDIIVEIGREALRGELSERFIVSDEGQLRIFYEVSDRLSAMGLDPAEVLGEGI